MSEIFPVVIINARPAAGKSEIIHALQGIPTMERAERFHIGNLEILDDFPLLWTWFEEDDLLERVFDRPRLHSTTDGYFIHQDLWHLLIRRLDLDYHKLNRDLSDSSTVIVEFSRGSSHGGYAQAYQHLSDDLLGLACSLYVKVSFEESLRKNRARFNPDRPDSILEHGLSDEKMERLYRQDDWQSFSDGDPNYLHVRDHRIPYAVFENEDDVTSAGGSRLLDRLQESTDQLWARRIKLG
ncbi:MAG: hypothetical protein WBR18_11255 [Anaerolineales bacterium]